MKCIICQTRPATNHPQWGILPCSECRATSRKLYLPTELVPQSIKDSRKEYADDIIQSSRDGVLNKRRLEVYGTKGLKVTQEQVDNARYVFPEIMPYKENDGKVI